MTELEFGVRLKQYRQQKHLTQQELADQLGVSNKSVSRWESGGYPDITLLLPLSQALGMSTDELLGGQPPAAGSDAVSAQPHLSFLLSLGGGAAFFFLDLALPGLVCYLLYLMALAWGISYQRRCPCRARWFYASGAVMNLFVSMDFLSSFLLLPLALQGDVLLSLLQMLISGQLHTAYLYTCLEHLIPWLFASLVLTGGTQLLALRLGGIALVPPSLRLSRVRPAPSKLLPALAPAFLLGFWCVYCVPFPLPVQLYQQQTRLFLVLWAIVTAAGLLLLTRKRHWWMLFPFFALQTACFHFPRLAEKVRIFSRLTGNLLPADPKYTAAVYVPFRQTGLILFLAWAVLTLLYLLCCHICFKADSEPTEKPAD